jgi:hypothetical protein
MKTCGTGVYVDFPTSSGNVYTRDAVETALSDPVLRALINAGTMVGGVINGTNDIISDIKTHKVINIRIYKDEIVVDYEVLDTPQAEIMFNTLLNPEAVLIMSKQVQMTGIINKIEPLRTVHLREKKIYVPK